MKKIVFFILISFSLSTNVFPQVVNDAGLWTTINVEKKITKKFSVFITEEYRTRENFTRLNLFYTDLGVTVRPYDFLKVSLAYRSIEKYLITETFSFRHRLMLDITLKKKFGKVGLSFRERIQAEVRNVYSSDNGKNPEWYSRNKFEIKYDINKPITPYASIEFRYQIHNPRAKEVDHFWHRNRYALGLEYKKSEKHSFSLYYLIQQEYNVSSPQNLYIVGIGYSLSL